MELEILEKQVLLLEKAYKTLEEPFSDKNFNDLEKDWIIQRFEYVIELSWKTCKKILDYEKVSYIKTPKNIFKEIYKLWIIKDLELWEDFLDIRNLMSHLYSEYTSTSSFEFISNNYKEIDKLIINLEKMYNF